MDLVTQQRISGRIWGSTICWGKRLHNDRILRRTKLRDPTYLSWYIIVKVSGVLRAAEIGSKWRRVTMNVRPINPAKERVYLQNYVEGSKNRSYPHEHDVTLINSTPSTEWVVPDGVMKALRLACTIIEFGRTTELEACEPKRSSGSHSSCCIRSTASCDTRGSVGKRKVCFQFKILCRVRWRYGTDAKCQNYTQNARVVLRNC